MIVDFELLVAPDCPNEAAAAELVATAIAQTGVESTITRTLIVSQDDAVQRGFIGSPRFLLNGVDPFAVSGAEVALACRLHSTQEGLAGVPGLRDLRQAVKGVAAG